MPSGAHVFVSEECGIVLVISVFGISLCTCRSSLRRQQHSTSYHGRHDAIMGERSGGEQAHFIALHGAFCARM